VYKWKNENGYALVSVLLVIVIFMILILSFFGQSFNSVKQNQIVEKNSQSVALAEMGISYYQAAVKNIYVKSQTDINNAVQSEIANDGSNQKSPDYYAQRAITLMKASIQSGLSSLPSIKQISPTASYQLISKNFDNNIVLTVLGTDNGKSTTLSTNMVLSPTVIGLSGNSGPTSGISISLSGIVSGFNNIVVSLTGLNSACNTPDSINIYNTCQKVYLNGTKSYSENNIGGGTSAVPYVIYSNSSLTLAGNANQLNYVQIHTEGTFNLGKNMNNASHVTLETKNSSNSIPAASFGSQLRLDSSQFYINGKMVVDGQFDVNNSSFVFVNGDAAINKHLNIDATSTLCVKGNLTASKVDAIGSLVVSGTINGKNSNTSMQVFQQKCSSSNTQTPTVKWGDQLLTTIDYQY
jgi:competence protein ComGC